MQLDNIERVARDERVARHAGFWWGFAEGTFFFIVPDAYISFAGLFSLRAGAVAWIYSIAGSVAAVCLISLLMVTLRLDYLALLVSIPGISTPMIARVKGTLAVEGLPYNPFLVLGGVPLKVYVAVAFSLGVSLGSVLLWTVFARIARIAPTYAVTAVVRMLFRRHIDAHANGWFALLGLFWLVFYVFYFIRMSRT
jgi:hypothetical protein